MHSIDVIAQSVAERGRSIVSWVMRAPSLPVDCELKSFFLLHLYATTISSTTVRKIIFFQCWWTVIALPYLSEVVSHREDSSFFFGG